ncbi:MAG: lysylphosphatidylglycerol synthase transmembrane domain-containing protein, partial [Candidatus Nanoarchaeia archaeon]|nr:lysylphosphatidylglycerol synthase transmembrane domain-containing protein [Candidatus Nanoarchaeia archaeon]
MGIVSFFKKYGISILILLLIIYFLKDKITIESMAEAFSKTNFIFYALGISVLIIPIYCHSLKYHLYLGKESPGIKNLMKMTFLSIHLNSTLPARAGDIFSAVYLKNKGVDFGKATGAVFAERATDLIVLLIMVLVFSVFISSEMNGIIADAVKMGAIMTIVLLLGVTFVLWKKKTFSNLAKKIKLLKEFDFESFLLKFQEGIKHLFRNKKITGVYFIASFLRWIGEAPNYYFMMLAAGIIISGSGALNFGYALFFLCIVALLWAIPLTPGGLGTVEAFTLLFFTPLGIPESTSITFLVLIRSMLLVYIIAGMFMTNKISGD